MLWRLSNLASSPIGHFMRTRHALLLSLASAALTFAPSLAAAQRINSRDCGDRYSNRYSDCRYEIDRSRAIQRETMRERTEQQRERTRWDAIVRQARAQARSYDLAERARQRSVDRAARTRVIRDEREERVRDLRDLRDRSDRMLRERSYRVRR